MRIRAVLIAGEIEDYPWHKKLIKEDDLVICADGGLAHALQMGILPKIIIGDLDSLEGSQKEAALSSGVKTLCHPGGKDFSDLELALDYALQAEPAEVIVLGALGGGRLDHLLANFFLLKKPLDQKIPASIVSPKTTIWLFDRSFKILGHPGDYLSLFALTAAVCGLTSKGLKYPFDDKPLTFASTHGLSNEFTGNSASVSFKKGLLLAIKTHRA